MSLKVISYSPDLLEDFEPMRPVGNLRELLKSNADNYNREVIGVADAEGKVIGFFGANYYRAGTAEVWMIPSKDLKEYKLGIFRMINSFVTDVLIGHLKLHRIELAVKYDWELGNRWAEKLGFTYEGRMRAYDLEGRDYALYAKVAPWQQAQR